MGTRLDVLYGAIVWFLLLSGPVAAATLLLARRRHPMLSAGERPVWWGSRWPSS